MRLGDLRSAALSAAVAAALASTGCVENARCADADEIAARAHAASAERDLRIAWLSQRIRALEAANAELAARLDRAQRAAPPEAPIAAAIAPRAEQRTLDPVVPYEVAGDTRGAPMVTSRAAPAPVRKLDATVPYLLYR